MTESSLVLILVLRVDKVEGNVGGKAVVLFEVVLAIGGEGIGAPKVVLVRVGGEGEGVGVCLNGLVNEVQACMGGAVDVAVDRGEVGELREEEQQAEKEREKRGAWLEGGKKVGKEGEEEEDEEDHGEEVGAFADGIDDDEGKEKERWGEPDAEKAEGVGGV